MGYEIRTVQPEDWAELRTLRLAALRDEDAPVAFCDAYDDAVVRSDDFWRDRATPAADGGAATHLVAVAGDGRWVGMLAVLDETRRAAGILPPPGSAESPALPQVHLVSVYVRPEHRGTGVAEQLVRAAVDWSWRHTRAERVRLWAHGDNARAFAFYLRLGFTRTGATTPFPPAPGETEHELEVRRGPRVR